MQDGEGRDHPGDRQQRRLGWVLTLDEVAEKLAGNKAAAATGAA